MTRSKTNECTLLLIKKEDYALLAVQRGYATCDHGCVANPSLRVVFHPGLDQGHPELDILLRSTLPVIKLHNVFTWNA